MYIDNKKLENNCVKVGNCFFMFHSAEKLEASSVV